MKTARYNKTGTRQLVGTGWKEFDRQTNCITTGNAVCNTQMSTYIRPFSETECNGHVFRPGELMAFDLKPYVKYGIPEAVLSLLEFKGRKDSLILYMFFTTPKGQTEPEPFLWVLTTKEPHPRLKISRVIYHFGQRYTKRFKAEEEILKYITEGNDEGT